MVNLSGNACSSNVYSPHSSLGWFLKTGCRGRQGVCAHLYGGGWRNVRWIFAFKLDVESQTEADALLSATRCSWEPASGLGANTSRRHGVAQTSRSTKLEARDAQMSKYFSHRR